MSKKVILGIALVLGAGYLLTRKKKNNSGTGTASGTSFMLARVTNPLWTKGVGVSAYEESRGWGTTNQLLVEKAGNESLLVKIADGTKLKLQDGTVITAENILDLNIDEFLRISTYEDISGLVSSASYPNVIAIV